VDAMYFKSGMIRVESQDSSLGIVSDYGLDDWMIGVRFPAGSGNFSL
jgi:hypothetical protein